MDLHSCMSHCSAVKGTFARLFAGVPGDFSFRSNGDRIFFLASKPGVGNSLFSVDVYHADDTHTWKMVLSPDAPRQLSRSEKLLRERMRATGLGITYYKYLESIDSLLVNTGGGCGLLPCSEVDGQYISYPSKVGAVDYKVCPGDSGVLGCISDGDIWILCADTNTSIQLTNTSEERPSRKVTAGQASFVLQEEFDRYTGYWWNPNSGKDGIYQILYEEVDETKVEIVRTFNPSNQDLEEYSYPRPGGVNATSILKLVQFKIENGELIRETLVLSQEVVQYLSKWEYLIRLGWTKDGENLWVHMLNREQNHSQVLLINIQAFIKEGEQSGSIPCPLILWEESSKTWINYNNIVCLEFLPSTDKCDTRILLTSEQSGFPHLVLLEGNLPSPSSPLSQPIPANLHAQIVTEGDWSVLDSQVWVDGDNDLIYFEGNKSSCLDKHLYVVNLKGILPSSDPVQLTPNGYYNNITIDTKRKLFVSVYSNQATPPSVAVYSIDHTSLQANLLFHIWNAPAPPPTYTPPKNFTALSSTGETLHGVVYPPVGLQEGKQYRTILYVYGGPAIQLVTHKFSTFLIKVSQWTHSGFAVVMLDNRGSSCRGSKFESYIQYRMGSVEVEDQVNGIKTASSIVSYIDPTRVGIIGWSYGGYMSLLSIAKRPQDFKIAIAGAPVTDWMWYDTGYTERYLGVPPDTSDAYERSSVIPLAEDFPNEQGRVLIIHGMSDENVFFTHTSLLLDALISHGKPYQLQIYNGERHGIRNHSSALHCDATTLIFLLKNL